MRDLRWRAGGLDSCHRFTGNHEFLGDKSQKMGADFAPQNAGHFLFGGFHWQEWISETSNRRIKVCFTWVLEVVT